MQQLPLLLGRYLFLCCFGNQQNLGAPQNLEGPNFLVSRAEKQQHNSSDRLAAARLLGQELWMDGGFPGVEGTVAV